MISTWYCQDCDRRIDADERTEHEANGHAVRGVMRPDRLLGNDPWNLDVQTDRGTEDDSEEVSE